MWRTSLLDLDRLKTPSSYKKSNYALELPLLGKWDRQSDTVAYCQQSRKIEDRSMVAARAQRGLKERVIVWLSVYLPPIDMSSNWLLLWNVVLVLAIAYNFIQIPIVLLIINYVYSDPYHTFQFIYADIGILIYLFLDLLLVRWRICFYKVQRKITNPLQIFQNYQRNYLIYDVIAFASYLIFVSLRQIPYIKILFYLKLGSLFGITQQIKHKIELNTFLWSLYKFIRLMVFIYFVISLGACIYFAIDYHYYLEQGFYYDYQYLWLTGSATTDNLNLITTFDWPEWYEYAMYLLLQCIRGVGYGDMTGRNPPELFFNSLVMLFNVWMFSYFAGGILNIVQKFRKDQIKISQQNAILNNCCEIYEVNEAVKKKSKLFIDSKRLKLNDKEENCIYQILSQQLKEDFLLTFNRQFSDNLPVLDTLFRNADNTWTNFAREVIAHMKTRYLYPGEVVIRAKQHISLVMGLIVRGRVRVCSAITEYEKKYAEWQYVGQTEFFLGGKTVNSVVCNSHTKIYYYERDPFFEVLSHHSEQRQKFCFLHDSVKINRKEGRSFALNCCICEGPHLEEFCDINQFGSNTIITRHLVGQQPVTQPRMTCRRQMSSLRKKLLRYPVKNQGVKELQVDVLRNFQYYYSDYNM